MTRIMRMRIPVSGDKEWVSIIPGADPEKVLVVRQSGEEVVVGVKPGEPIEPQLSRELAEKSPPG